MDVTLALGKYLQKVSDLPSNNFHGSGLNVITFHSIREMPPDDSI